VLRRPTQLRKHVETTRPVQWVRRLAPLFCDFKYFSRPKSAQLLNCVPRCVVLVSTFERLLEDSANFRLRHVQNGNDVADSCRVQALSCTIPLCARPDRDYAPVRSGFPAVAPARSAKG
jgi:hypothetical protein